MTRLITIFDKNLNQRVFRLFDENEIVHKIDTNLTISASSASIDVGNNVELTGVLTDENSVPLGGMSIRILKNNVLVDTVTTNSSGAYSKTITGLDIGTYHFHASYAGNDVYDNALSSTIDVSVVGHTYVVTITSDKQTALVGDNVTISGTLTRDSVGYGGQSVRIFDDGVLLDTVTTDNNGDYTKTISNLTLGTHRYSSQFDAVESNIAVVEVNNHIYDIDITADNPIIESGDTATITATLTDNTVPVVGETLSYTVSHDSTTIDSGTLTTGSNGSASFSYNGTGVGDVTIEIDYSTLLQETFVVQDCRFFDPSSPENVSLYGSSSDFSYDSTEQAYYISTSSAKNITRDSVVGDFDFEISMDFKATSTNTEFYCGESNGSNYECQGRIIGTSLSSDRGVATYYTNGNIVGRVINTLYSLDTTKWYHYKVTRENNVLTAQILDGDTVIATATDSNVIGTSGNVSWHNYVARGTMYWKNIKFKPL